MESEELREALLALCDMVGQHASCGECEKTGATIVPEGMTSSDAEAISVLLKHGYLKKYSMCMYSFTQKSSVWGPKDA